MDALLDAAYERDVGVYSVARYAALPLERQGLLLGYSLIDVPDIRRGIKRLAEAYREVVDASVGPAQKWSN